MMRSMYSGVSGLKNHQTRMDVIGNNIANVNTAGFKKSRVVFKDSLYQSIRGAARATGARGGTNPMAVGLGMTLSSIDQIHTPSPTTVTNKMTDLAINGNGYFIVDNGGETFYTRAGAFDFDVNGNLVAANGYRVRGWVTDKTIDPNTGKWMIDASGDTVPINIWNFKTSPPRATTEMLFAGNLDSNLPATGIDPTTDTDHPDEDESVVRYKEYFDSLGNKQTLYFRFFKTSVDAGPPPVSHWACDISLSRDFENSTDPPYSFEAVDVAAGGTPTGGTTMIRAYNIDFNEMGSINDPDNAAITIGIDRSAAGADDLSINIDFAALTQLNDESDARVDRQDGYTQGSLSSITVDSNGVIQGVYDNGTTNDLARVAIATFENPAGLLQKGGSLFQVSNNSGDPRVGAPGEQGMGEVLPGNLEMSNVDLSEEFTDMIVTQRGFQANSRIITTSDEMLQELVNLKR